MLNDGDDPRPLLAEGQQSQAQNDRSADGLLRDHVPRTTEMESCRLPSHKSHNDDRVFRQARSPTRRAKWSFAALFVMFAVSILGLASLLLSLNPVKPSIESQANEESPPSQTFKRNNDYTLDQNWDFFAPGQVREHEWTITDEEGNPDGVRKPMMLINNQFPGPLIEMNEGDTLVVKLINKASNATALHWHGIFQNGTNWMDGAAGVTQCPIAPGQSYEYRFNITGQSGTYFYHGHQGVQALDGLVGPIVVHNHREAGRPSLPYSSDRVVLLQDWWYDPASGLMRDVLSPGVEDAPIPNTALMNGVNQAVCDHHPNRECTEVDVASLPHLDVAKGDRHRIRFINVGGLAWFQVAVDGHDDMQVVEVDGTIVEPTLGSPLVIAPGQRYSVILRADHDDGAFWLRAKMVTSCFAEQKLPEDGIDEARAIVRYTNNLKVRHGDHGDMEEDEDDEDDDDDDDDDREDDDDGDNDDDDEDDDKDEDEAEEDPVSPQTTSELPFLSVCRDLSSTMTFLPSPQESPPEVADHSWYLRVNLAIGDWRLQRGVMNSSSFRPNLKYPTLHRVLDGLSEKNESFAIEGINTVAFDAESELVISNKRLETVDIILQNMDENSHPFHLHGMKMWVLGQGHGYFPGYKELGLLPEGKGLLDPTKKAIIKNPLKRDTITVEGFGWVLLRFVADNPGVWLFHCHVIWHSEAGMGMQILSRTDDLRDLQVPEEARKLCDAPEEQLRKGAPPRDDVFFGFGNDD